MRKVILATCLLLLSGFAASAQEPPQWHRLAPKGEEFSTQTPQPAAKLMRVLPLSAKLKATPVVYETEAGGIWYAIIAFDRPPANRTAPFSTLNTFAAGFRFAVEHAQPDKKNAVTNGPAVNITGVHAREYRVHVGERDGRARVYATKAHYYVVMTLGGSNKEASVEQFFNLFMPGEQNPNRTLGDFTAEAEGSAPADANAAPWPQAGR